MSKRDNDQLWELWRRIQKIPTIRVSIPDTKDPDKVRSYEAIPTKLVEEAIFEEAKP
jgi:hypothetical protein